MRKREFRNEIKYAYSDNTVSECGETPFLLAARGNRSVFLRVWGEELSASAGTDPPSCATSNRVLVYEAHSSRLVRAICPGEGRAVHVLAEERRGARGAALLVVWAAREAGGARLAWMEVWRGGDGGVDAEGAVGSGNASAGCAHWCGSLGACMAGALWCDGAADCPGGADEAGACGAGARLLAVLGAGGAAGGAVAAAAAAVLLALAAACVRRRRRAGADKRLLGALAAGRRLTEELLYDASRASSAASS